MDTNEEIAARAFATGAPVDKYLGELIRRGGINVVAGARVAAQDHGVTSAEVVEGDLTYAVINIFSILDMGQDPETVVQSLTTAFEAIVRDRLARHILDKFFDSVKP